VVRKKKTVSPGAKSEKVGKKETKTAKPPKEDGREKITESRTWHQVLRNFVTFYANKVVGLKSIQDFGVSIQERFQANPNRKPTPHIDKIRVIHKLLVKLEERAIKEGAKKIEVTVSPDFVSEIKTILKKYKTVQMKKRAKIVEQDLSGTSKKKVVKKKVNSGFINSMDLKGIDFNTIKLSDKWAESIGERIELPFNMMIFGKGGKGKSSYAIQLAKYLAESLHKKVLYVADEEKIGYLLNDKFERFDAHHKNLDVADSLDKAQKVGFSNYDFVIFDSATSIGLTPEIFEKIVKQNNGTSFVSILQSTKEGAFRGSNVWEHLVDVEIRFEDGIAKTEKSRFGGKGEVEVW